MARTREKRCQRQRHHHRKVEEDRRRGRPRKAVHDVEHAAIKRHQRNQQQIGKGDPRQLDRQPALLGVLGEARREDAHGLRHEQPGDHQQDHLRQKQQCEDAIREQARRRLAALAMDMRIGRHEGGVERALGEDGAKMIGQAQRHEKRVRHRAGAENGGEHDIARKAGQPRKERIAADREDASEHAPLLAHIRCRWHQNRSANPLFCRVFFTAPPCDEQNQAESALRTALMMRSCVGASR